MSGLVLDAGALIAYERKDQRVRALVRLAVDGNSPLATSSAVIAQVWRGGRQAHLARLLRAAVVEEVALDREASRRIGVGAAATGATDVVDGHVAVIAGDRDARVLTSDAGDIAAWGVPRRMILVC